MTHYSKNLAYSSEKKPDYLIKGDIAHKCLEHYYKNQENKNNKQEAIDLMRNEIVNSQVDVETGESMVLTMRDYFDYYPDNYLKVLEVEKSFSVVLHEDEDLTILLEGRMDLIVLHESVDRVLIVDHKTSEKFDPPNLLDNQYCAYAFASKVTDVMENKIVWGRPVKSKFNPSTKFHRTTLQYTSEFLEEWRQNSIYWILKFDQENQLDYHPPNYRSCKYCQFKRVCEWPNEDFRQKQLDAQFSKREVEFDLFGE